YTQQELQAHWHNIRRLAAEKDNYRYITSKAVPPNLLLYGKGSLGALMIKSDAPNVAFAFSEMNMANAFWDYLEDKAGAR
ncbi:MAG: hypothetical protein GX572_00980, partial [Clostridia bacterium]|nr:hypothetical protein [Clostridia bacterium]